VWTLEQIPSQAAPLPYLQQSHVHQDVFLISTEIAIVLDQGQLLQQHRSQRQRQPRFLVQLAVRRLGEVVCAMVTEVHRPFKQSPLMVAMEEMVGSDLVIYLLSDYSARNLVRL
jgi:hypothetical protein